MSYDGVVTRAVYYELKNLLSGGKLQKIYQPSKNTIILKIYSLGKNYNLFLSANNQESRVNLTKEKYENPEKPFDFCMVLRKHLNQAKILSIKQHLLDRVLIFSFSCLDEMQFTGEKKLIVEIMGKYSNIILTDENFKVIDSIKRVSNKMSSVRQVLPGLKYEFPVNEKIDILEDNFYQDILYLDKSLPNNYDVNRIFYENYAGLSPDFTNLILNDVKFDRNLPWQLITQQEKEDINRIFNIYIQKIRDNDFTPSINITKDKFKNFYAFKNPCYESTIDDQSMSIIIDEYFLKTKEKDRLRQIKNEIKSKVNLKKKNVEKKIHILNQNINNTDKMEKLKTKADLMAANVHLLSRGMESLKVNNIFSDNSPITLTVDPTKDPWENVNDAYKRYKKLKNSREFALNDLPKQENDLNFLIQMIDYLERAKSISELEEIKDELINNNIIRQNSKDKKRKKIKLSKPIHYITENGIDIFVGKNSRQNDQLTMKFATRDDLFFHVKDFPGSHVILKNSKEVKEEDIKAACFLAAVNSSQRDENKIIVDYTYKKFVKKSKNAKDGMVYYENFKTVTVVRDEFKKNLRQIH